MWIKIAILTLIIRLAAIYFVSRNDNYYEGVFKTIVDIDYKVYLDAASYDSPYQRHTYRYSPLLAWMMQPSLQIHQIFGKVLIALFDVIAVAFIYKIFENRSQSNKQINQKAANIIAFTYCLNPGFIYITARGSCEGITMALAAAFWYFYFGGNVHGNMSPVERVKKGYTQRQPSLIKKYISYAIFGLWVHFRVYPIIFVPLLIMHQYHSAKENKLKQAINFTIEFGLIAGGVFVALAAFFYHLYGYDFLHQTYFYHITRRDNRHSKSIYFYELYLNYKNDSISISANRIFNRLLPVIITILTVSFVFVKKRSIFFCQGLITCYFIIFNRVITDQYYIWLFTSMCFSVPELEPFRRKSWSLVILKLVKFSLVSPLPLLLWLLMALKLENGIQPITIFHIWLCSAFILIIHTIMVTNYFIDTKAYSQQYQKKLKIEQAKRLLSTRLKND